MQRATSLPGALDLPTYRCRCATIFGAAHRARRRRLRSSGGGGDDDKGEKDRNDDNDDINDDDNDDEGIDSVDRSDCGDHASRALRRCGACGRRRGGAKVRARARGERVCAREHARVLESSRARVRGTSSRHRLREWELCLTSFFPFRCA